MRFLSTIFIHFDPVGTQYILMVSCHTVLHDYTKLVLLDYRNGSYGLHNKDFVVELSKDITFDNNNK